jgi:nitrite reductase/ring-hydroxylating ferredoxin subunit
LTENAASLLCRLDELPDPGARVIDGVAGSLLVARSGAGVAAYVNACPHKGTPLENPLGMVADADLAHLVCSTHGARFRLSDGVCVSGPCVGGRLTAVPIAVRDGRVFRRAANPTKV